MSNTICGWLLCGLAVMAVGWTQPALGAEASTTAMVRVEAGFPPVGEGAVSTIVRGDQGISVTVHTFDLEPGAYTVWNLIWNSPENCADAAGCLPPPEGPDVPDSVVFGAGGVVGPSGRGNFGYRLNIGDTSGVVGGSERLGLTDAIGAEVHAIVVHHGALIPGMILEQLSTPNAGCDGPCPAVQAAAHSPGGETATSKQINELRELVRQLAIFSGMRPQR